MNSDSDDYYDDEVEYSNYDKFILKCVETKGDCVKFLQVGSLDEYSDYDVDEMLYMIRDILDPFEKYSAKTKTMDIVKSAFMDYFRDIYPKEFQNVISASTIESNQVLQVTFADTFGGKAIFHLKKNSFMKSLRNLGADAVIKHVKQIKDIEKLEMPNTLASYLMEEFRHVKNYDKRIEIAADDGYYGFFGVIDVSKQSCFNILKKLGAAVIVENIQNEKDIEMLVIPKLLYKDLESRYNKNRPFVRLNHALHDFDSDDEEDEFDGELEVHCSVEEKSYRKSLIVKMCTC